MTITIKTKGGAPAAEMQFEQKQIADALEFEVSGYPCIGKRVEHATQEFVDKHNIVAQYTSGTFRHFKISDAASDEFAAFPRY